MAPDSIDIPWRSTTIEMALDLVTEPLITRGLATEQRGASDKAIRAAAKRLGNPLSDEIQAFYRRVTPVPECPEFGFGSVVFQPRCDRDLV